MSPVVALRGRPRCEKGVQRGKQDEGPAALLDDEGKTHENAAREEGEEPPRLDRPEQHEAAGQRGKEQEVLGVRGEALEPGAERQDGEDGRRRDGHGPAEEPGRDEEHDDARGRVDDEQPQMDPGDRSTEEGERGGVGGVHAGELGVIRRRVRRDSLEQELPEVGVLALVPVERRLEQAKPHRPGPEEHEGQQNPGSEARSLIHRGRRDGRRRCRRAGRRCPRARSSRSRARSLDARWRAPWRRSARPEESSYPGG